MRRILIMLAALVLPIGADAASSNIADLKPGRYVLDNKHSSLVARVKHLGASNYTVRFDKLDGEFTYDPAHPEATNVEAGIDTTSLDVGASYSQKFADQFLNATKFPKATFVSKTITPDPDGRTGTMTGDLTLDNVTLPVTLKVAFVGTSHGFPFGTVAGFSATGTFRRSDFGSRSLLSYVGDDISLEIEAEFDRK